MISWAYTKRAFIPKIKERGLCPVRSFYPRERCSAPQIGHAERKRQRQKPFEFVSARAAIFGLPQHRVRHIPPTSIIREFIGGSSFHY